MKIVEAMSTRQDGAAAFDEIRAALSDAGADSPPDLGFVFFSHHHKKSARTIVESIRRELGVAHLLGCTGETIIGDGREIERAHSLSLWLAWLPGVDVRPFRLGCEQTPDGFYFPLEPPDLFADPGPNASVILLGEPFSMPVDVYLRRFNEDHRGIPIIGGMASGAVSPDRNLLVLDDAQYREGAVGVYLSGDFRMRSVVSQGCRPVGKPMVVTACDRNTIHKLGGRSALQSVQELFTQLTPEERQLFQAAPHLGVVMNERQECFGPGDFLIRNIIGVDPAHGAIFVSEWIRLGQTVQFHLRDASAASADLKTLLDIEKGRCGGNGQVGGLVFSCNGRGSRLFTDSHHDVTAVRRTFGKIPISGFFAQGEVGPVGTRNHLHGFTACVALFSRA